MVAGRLRWLEDNGVGSPFMEMGDSGDTQGLSLIYIARNGAGLG